MKPILHMFPLEAYRERYTENLLGWELSAFQEDFTTWVPAVGASDRTFLIREGEVLDTVQRPLWALEQMAYFVKNVEIQETKTTEPLMLYFSDFFHPGIEALPYLRKNICASAFCWAQSWDVHDFTYKIHKSWMRRYERMALGIFDRVFVASSLLRELILASELVDPRKVIQVGLPFNSSSVILQAMHCAKTEIETLLICKGIAPKDRPIDCVFTSRFDEEKSPDQFLKLAARFPNKVFAICTGRPKLTGSATSSLTEARSMAQMRPRNLIIFEGLTKPQYYQILRHSKLQFNCAKQDWVSFTLLEALALGAMPVYPNFRSFPEVLPRYCLYDNYQEATIMVSDRLRHYERGRDSFTLFQQDLAREVLGYHDGTLSRISCDLFNCWVSSNK